MTLNTLSRLQLEDGSFGPFHSMSSNGIMTTERALRRFYFLNLTPKHEVVKKALTYVHKCLHREIIISDRPEKVIHWESFCDLMFSAWLLLFSFPSSKANEVRSQWISILEKSIVNGAFDPSQYNQVYCHYIKPLHSGERAISPASFYVVALVKNGLNKGTTKAYFEYIMQQGVYYIYDKPLHALPEIFGSKDSFSYLEAIRLVLPYAIEKEDLSFVKEWVEVHFRQIDQVARCIKTDGLIFPKLAENWRSKKAKQMDINNYFIEFLELLA